MIDIVKLANGNVAIYDSTSGDFINSLNPDVVEIECNANGIVKVEQDNASVEYFDPANVANTQVLPAAAIPFTGTCADLAALLASDFFFVVSGGSASDLATVLAVGNSAGAFDIDMNGNDLLNVNQITSAGDLFLNPVGSIDCNGHNINLTGGELHNCPLIHSQNNTDIVIEGKGTGDIILKTNNINRLTITDAGVFTGMPNLTINGTTQDLSIARTFTVTDANLSTSDITTNNVSTTKHGFVPKAPNDAKKYLDGTGAWTSLPAEIQLAASDETTALTTGTAKVTFRMPFAMTVTAVRASLTTAQTSGSIFTVDINESGTTILSTKLTIDNTEKTSVTAATPPVISDTALADDAEITIDIDQIGDGTAKGLKITIIGTR